MALNVFSSDTSVFFVAMPDGCRQRSLEEQHPKRTITICAWSGGESDRCIACDGRMYKTGETSTDQHPNRAAHDEVFHQVSGTRHNENG